MFKSVSDTNVEKPLKTISRFEYIDALRGMAVFLVILCHCHQVAMPVYHRALAFSASLGARGVQLFFIISAFTLCYSKTKRASQGETSNISFFIRRYFRLAPMYYLGIIYFIFQSTIDSTYWIDGDLGLTTGNVLSNVFFLNSLSPYWIDSIVPGGWSISVEFIFYLLFPLIFNRVRSLVTSINLLMISIIIQIVTSTLLKTFPLVEEDHLWSDYLFHYLPNQLPVFCLGIIAFQLIFKSDFKWKGFNRILAAVTLILLVVFWKFVTLHHIVIGMAFMVLMIFMSKGKFTFLVNSVSTYLGKVSYSAYLVHFVILFFIDRLGYIHLFETGNVWMSFLNFSIIFIVTIILTTGLSTITYKLIEKPFMKLGQKLIA